jgi:oxygen-dependent protoporphyrinogen oxidase
MAHIVIIGGGIAGLSAAYDLHRDGRHRVTVLERSSRLGGKVITHYLDGLTIEGGPDSVFTTKPWAVDLMVELGLESELDEPIGSGFSVLVGGKLHSVPRALASLMPTASSALESIGFLGAAARRRILSENNIAKGTGSDETIASFFRRRFGSRFSKTLAEPLLAGIHAGSAEILSMKALYPSYIGLEQKHGSLSAVAQAYSHAPTPTPAAAAHRKPGFLTLHGGLQRLIDALVSDLDGVDLHTGYVAERIEKTSGGKLRILGDQPFEADAVIVSIPAYAAAQLLQGIIPEAYEDLMQIRHASTAVATLAYRSGAFKSELHGNGFLVPADEPADITGCTFSSLKWRNRAPDGCLLIRAFMGQDGGMNVDDFSDDQLLEKAHVTFTKLLKGSGAPIFTRIDRWTNAMPQYDLGHCDRMDRVERALGDLPILMAGSSFRGTGIPDCIRQGRQAARTVLARDL